MKKIATILAGMAILLGACKKEKDPEPCSCPAPASPSGDMYHFPLTVGSYWVYESLMMDSAFNITSTSCVDSVFISGDTMIGGKQYFVKESITISGSASVLLIPTGPQRDSAGYIVNPNGSFIKHDDFTNILATNSSLSPPYSMVARMAHKDSVVTVPAGTFNTVDYEEHVYIMTPGYPYNRNKYNHTVMADNVGIVFRSACFASAPSMIGHRLLRYYIAP